MSKLVPHGRKRVIYGANVTPKKEHQAHVAKQHHAPKGSVGTRTHHTAKAHHHIKKQHRAAKKHGHATFATLGDALKSVGLLE